VVHRLGHDIVGPIDGERSLDLAVGVEQSHPVEERLRIQDVRIDEDI